MTDQARPIKNIVLSQVADSATSTTIVPTQANSTLTGQRVGFIIENTSSAILYVDLSGGTATSTSYSFQLAQLERWESPAHFRIATAVTGIWATDPGDGQATVTEFSY